MTQSSTVSITFSFCLMPAYAHIQLRERTHIEGSGGEREVGREVRGEEGESQRARRGHRVPSEENDINKAFESIDN